MLTSSAGEDLFASGCKGMIKYFFQPREVKNEPSPSLCDLEGAFVFLGECVVSAQANCLILG